MARFSGVRCDVLTIVRTILETDSYAYFFLKSIVNNENLTPVSYFSIWESGRKTKEKEVASYGNKRKDYL